MSRGPGRIEAAIATAFLARPNETFTVADLVTIVFPQARPIAKRHRVSVIRAADKVAGMMGRQKIVSGVPKEARYERVAALHKSKAQSVPLVPECDEIANRVADHVVSFLRGVLDPPGLRAFVGELERTSVEHLRRRL